MRVEAEGGGGGVAAPKTKIWAGFGAKTIASAA